jgi:hypothetical protein
MLQVGFEPAISASQRPQTHPLDRAAIGIGHTDNRQAKISAHIHLFLFIYQLVKLLLHT